MRISPFGAAMTISNVASISIMGLSRARRHRDFLFEADRMTSKISAAETDCDFREGRPKENPATPLSIHTICSLPPLFCSWPIVGKRMG
jgi:hypothetical protein